MSFLAHGRGKKDFSTRWRRHGRQRKLASRTPALRIELVFAGNFMTGEESDEFDQLPQKPEFAAAVKSLGFVTGDQKSRALREADLFCFPTQYLGENQPVNLIEAMAFGLPIVTTRWRSLPEMLPPGFPGLVNGQDPDEIATALLHMLGDEIAKPLREFSQPLLGGTISLQNGLRLPQPRNTLMSCEIARPQYPVFIENRPAPTQFDRRRFRSEPAKTSGGL